jgi:hypothetical protein
MQILKSMKNKKADLINEIITIIIAIPCIILLIILAFNLYGLLLKKTAFEQAKENLNQIYEKINNLKDKETSSYLITAPKDWYFVHYSEYVRPSSCLKSKSCLCFCPEDKLESCDKSGVCKGFDFEILLLQSIKIDKFPELRFTKEKEKLIINQTLFLYN